jgi:hypothetical protein
LGKKNQVFDLLGHDKNPSGDGLPAALSSYRHRTLSSKDNCLGPAVIVVFSQNPAYTRSRKNSTTVLERHLVHRFSPAKSDPFGIHARKKFVCPDAPYSQTSDFLVLLFFFYKEHFIT